MLSFLILSVLVIAGIGTVLPFAFYLRNYSVSLRYSPRVDYQLPNSPNAEVHEFAFMGDKALLPNSMSGKTHFLRIELKPKFFAPFLVASIRLYCQGVVIEHCFERGARGIRYLNVSRLICNSNVERSGGSSLEIKCVGTRLASSHAEIISFNTELQPDGNILIVSPHPDDAEIAAGAMYAENAARTWITTVSSGGDGRNIFSAVYSDDNPSILKPLKAYVRACDSILAPQLVGVKTRCVENLHYPDGALVSLYSNRDMKHAKLDDRYSWENLVNSLKKRIIECEPSVIIMPHGQIDSHGDHWACGLAVLEALLVLDVRPTLMLYANHSSTELYPLGGSHCEMTIPILTSEDIFIDSIVSYPVGHISKLRKRLLLLAMHDLKDMVHQEEIIGIKSTIKAIKQKVLKQLWPNESYFRRALRPSELFYVVQPGSFDIYLKKTRDMGVVHIK